jgi:hypothetical protein
LALNAWTRDAGRGQLRIVPANFPPTEGLRSFVLGHDLQHQVESMSVGSYVEISQARDVGSAKLLTFKGRIRPPSTVPSGVVWTASIKLDDVVQMAQDLTPGWTRDLDDWAINLSKLVGVHSVAFRLELGGTSGTYDVELPAFYVDAISLTE